MLADQRSRREAAFQADDLALLCLCQAKLLLSVLGLASADRVADCARELIAVHVALDEVVLCTSLDRGSAGRLVGKPGQHNQGQLRRLRSNLVHALRPLAGDRAPALAATLGALIDGVYLRAVLDRRGPTPEDAHAMVQAWLAEALA